MLKRVENSAEALYYLAAEPSILSIYGQYFYLTHPTMPAKHALKNPLSKKILAWSKKVIQLALE